MRRGSSQTQPLLLRGQSTKTPRDWKSFLSNDENKRNFINLLLQLWEDDKYAEQLKDREIIFASAEQCTRLTSSDRVRTESTIVHSLCSSHEEADNRIIVFMQPKITVMRLSSTLRTQMSFYSCCTLPLKCQSHYSYRLEQGVIADSSTYLS